jgi:hypothetical protein
VARDVGVGVTDRAAVGRNRDAADHERTAGGETVQVVAGAGAAVAPAHRSTRASSGRRPAPAPASGARIASATMRSSGVVILMFDASPSTEPNGVTGALGQRGLVGALRVRPRCVVERSGEHVAPEGLRRLREERSSRARSFHRRAVRGVRLQVGPTARFTVSRACSAASAAPDSAAAVNRASDDVRAHERARRVVDHDQLARRRGGAKRVRHRVLTPIAAGDEAHRRRRVASARR